MESKVWSLYQKREGESNVLYEVASIIGLRHHDVVRIVRKMKARRRRAERPSRNPAAKPASRGDEFVTGKDPC